MNSCIHTLHWPGPSMFSTQFLVRPEDTEDDSIQRKAAERTTPAQCTHPSWYGITCNNNTGVFKYCISSNVGGDGVSSQCSCFGWGCGKGKGGVICWYVAYISWGQWANKNKLYGINFILYTGCPSVPWLLNQAIHTMLIHDVTIFQLKFDFKLEREIKGDGVHNLEKLLLLLRESPK